MKKWAELTSLSVVCSTSAVNSSTKTVPKVILSATHASTSSSTTKYQSTASIFSASA